MGETENKTIPTFLKVLCILTFIGSGLAILGSLLLIIGAGALMANIPGLGSAMGGSTVYLVLSLIFAAGSFYGALQMMKGQKLGFFIYTGANAAAFIAATIFGAFSIVSLIITGGFIALYAINLKSME
ncbi:MAG TPA: hypothetical protein DHW82_12310 [Spirochaetia bacterium]|nr:MAG: hypothetical protein A2Y41_02845 [Spirochaetes bacterium GWB1_36_13]HCL57774.1 hypothetical protein [Spirochaetia bacterium]